MTQEVSLGSKKIHNAWAMFDWANSAYALIITVAIFPPYLLFHLTESISVLGIQLQPESVMSFALSIAYFIIAIISPIIGGIADYSGRRKFFMKFFTYLGGTACISMFFFSSFETVWIGLTGFILATIGYSGSLMVYNSFLPLITIEPNFDKLSARGFTYGYIGSIILLIACLIIITFPSFFALPEVSTLPVRLSFLAVGLWWIGFAQVSFIRLPEGKTQKITKKVLTKGWEEIVKVKNWLNDMRFAKNFLLTFFVYTAGVQTVMFLATTFAESVLQLGTSKLILTILILQIIAIGGAYLFAYLSRLKGNIFSIQTMLVLWVIICVMAYYVQTEFHFYLMAALVGSVMGGIQSLSRSTFSKLIYHKPKDVSSFFAFYDVLEKIAIILGTFSFGLVSQLTGNIRNSVIILGVFFVLSLILTFRLKVVKEDPVEL